MKHTITVEFTRNVDDNLDIARENFPGLPPGQQLRYQFRAELNASEKLKDTYTIKMTTICGGIETYYADFEFQHDSSNPIKAAQDFQAMLQEVFDTHGVTGEFTILIEPPKI